MSRDKITIKDFANTKGQLVQLDESGFLPLPPPYDDLDLQPRIKPATEEARKKYECDLDGIIGFKFPRPETEDENASWSRSFFPA